MTDMEGMRVKPWDVQFVWEGGDTVLNTHPMDIDQIEARRGTPYYVETKVGDGL